MKGDGESLTGQHNRGKLRQRGEGDYEGPNERDRVCDGVRHLLRLKKKKMWKVVKGPRR